MKKLRSRITVEGLDRAPHRAFLRALGLKDADLQKPFVGVASTDGRVTPCNALLGAFARAACAGVREAGGVPFDFASIAVADSMSMNHGGMRSSLVSRELIADGVEAVARGHAYDALVAFAGCDKTLPGMMMALVRLNLPGVFVYGGAALPGRWVPAGASSPPIPWPWCRNPSAWRCPAPRPCRRWPRSAAPRRAPPASR